MKNWRVAPYERILQKLCLALYLVLVLVLVILNSDGSLAGFPDTTNTTQCPDMCDYRILTMEKEDSNIFHIGKGKASTDFSHF